VSLNNLLVPFAYEFGREKRTAGRSESFCPGIMRGGLIFVTTEKRGVETNRLCPLSAARGEKRRRIGNVGRWCANLSLYSQGHPLLKKGREAILDKTFCRERDTG